MLILGQQLCPIESIPALGAGLSAPRVESGDAVLGAAICCAFPDAGENIVNGLDREPPIPERACHELCPGGKAARTLLVNRLVP